MSKKTIQFLLLVVRNAALLSLAFILGYQWRDQTTLAELPERYPNLTASCHVVANELTSLKIALTKANQDIERKQRELNQATKLVNSKKDSHCGKLIENSTQGLYEEAFEGIYSSDSLKRKKSLLALAELGNSEAKTILLKIVMDEQENAELRRQLIRTMDWHTAIPEAIHLLNSSQDEAIKAAVILGAESSQLDGIEKESFEDNLMAVFNRENGDFIQITAIDYLANHNPSKISDVVVVSDKLAVAAKVHQHINAFLKK